MSLLETSSGVSTAIHWEYEMNLSQEETQTVILALREYREHWNTKHDQELFEEINHLMRRFQQSLNQKVIYEERIEKKMRTLTTITDH